jgi:p-hydroxybenzoate 3-monooxygenase
VVLNVASRTTVGIIGARPAGLMLSHLLAKAGIESVATDIRSRQEIEATVRAGILEADSVRLLVDSGFPTACCTRGTPTRASTCGSAA